MSDLQTYEVNCGGADAVVEVMGRGPDVLMIGAAAPMALIRPTAIALARRGFRVTNFDYGSGHPRPDPRTAIEQIDDVIVVMDAVGLGAPCVVGVSRGAITAFGLAARRSQRVSGLVLVCPVAPFADTLLVGNPQLEPEPGESEEGFMRKSLLSVFSETFLDGHLEEAMSLVTTPAGSVARVDRQVEDVVDESETARCPTLVIEAAADRIVTSEHPLRFLRAIPDAEHLVISGAGHGWPMEEPDALAGLIADFVSEGSGG